MVIIAQSARISQYSGKNFRFYYDTSYLISVCQSQWWLNGFLPHLKGYKSNCDLVIALSVEKEFNAIYSRKVRDDYGVLKIACSLDELLDQIHPNLFDDRFVVERLDKSTVQTALLNYVLKSNKYHKGEMLSQADIRIIDGSYRSAKEGIHSFVLTEDSDITKEIDRIKVKEPNIPLWYLSYFNLTLESIPIINAKFLITDKLISELSVLDAQTSFCYYVGVLRGQDWGIRTNEGELQFKNDIAVHLSKQRTPNTPHSEGMEYLPVCLYDNARGNIVSVLDKAMRISQDSEYFILLSPSKNKATPLIGIYQVNKAFILNRVKEIEEKIWGRIDISFLRKTNPFLERLI